MQQDLNELPVFALVKNVVDGALSCDSAVSVKS
jgi:hypothetical protein